MVAGLNAQIGRALASADPRKRFDDMGLVARASSPEEFGGSLVAEMTRWKAVLGGRKP